MRFFPCHRAAAVMSRKKLHQHPSLHHINKRQSTMKRLGDLAKFW